MIKIIFIKKIFKFLIESILKVISYPYPLFITFFFQEKKIYNLVYKHHFTPSKQPKFNLNERLFELNYYSLPIKLQKKLITSSMGNPTEGVEWAKSYRKLGFPDKHTDKNLAYKYLSSYIKQNKDKKVCIHQVCASSGREINYFSKRSDHIIFEASDISEEIAKNIKSNYENLKCFCIDLADPEQLSFVTSRADLIVAFGGLQYLLPCDLKNFFENCKAYKTELIISQPIDSALSPYSLKYSIPRGNFSWSHPYLYLANKFSFKVKNASTFFMPENPWAQTFTAHFKI